MELETAFASRGRRFDACAPGYTRFAPGGTLAGREFEPAFASRGPASTPVHPATLALHPAERLPARSSSPPSHPEAPLRLLCTRPHLLRPGRHTCRHGIRTRLRSRARRFDLLSHPAEHLRCTPAERLPEWNSEPAFPSRGRPLDSWAPRNLALHPAEHLPENRLPENGIDPPRSAAFRHLPPRSEPSCVRHVSELLNVLSRNDLE
jgi:hypothetical protein